MTHHLETNKAPQTRFLDLLDSLNTRYHRGLLSYFGVRDQPLRRWLTRQYAAQPGLPGSLFADPVFESKFGYRQVQETLADLARTGRLDRDLVRNLDAPPRESASERLPRTIHPYTHQMEAWAHLMAEEPRSVVVSAGTGSGKTECFLIPILNDLARQVRTRRRLVGVQALFLYPLNALINSQRARLAAWTRGFEGRIRFCLYNGNTPDVLPEAERRRHPEEVMDRETLRADPPPILLTNATMLEYMLVRPEDHPILEASRGALKYVVVDEAHTYLGSQAAELSLLLRRVLAAFDVRAEDVRFVATSATIATRDRDSLGRTPDEALRRFLAAIAGQSDSQVHVVFGHSDVPPLPLDAPAHTAFPDLEVLTEADPEARYQALADSHAARNLRAELARRPGKLSELVRALHGPDRVTDSDARRDTVARLQLMTSAMGRDGMAFLPLRMHRHARIQPGLWACANPACPGRKDSPLDDPAWPFGKVHLAERTVCDACHALVYELVFCHTCGASFLAGHSRGIGGAEFLLPEGGEVMETLVLDPAEEDAMVSEEDEAEQRKESEDLVQDGLPGLHRHPIILLGRPGDSEDLETLDPETGEYGAARGPAFLPVEPDEEGRMRCPNCGAGERGKWPFWRPARNVVSFTQGILLPGLLEWTPPAQGAGEVLPLQGRRLITFSDSRQGTARFAVSTQVEAERNYVRSLIYHTVWEDRSRAGGALEEARKQRRELEAYLSQSGPVPPVLQALLAQAREKEARLVRGEGVPLNKVVDILSQRLELQWMHRARADYDPFDLDYGDLAALLVIREFVRRPSRRRSLETLGLVSLTYPFLQRIRTVPDLWQALKGTLEEWRDFLKLCLDYFVRANTALTVHPDLYRWMGTRIRPSFILPPGEKRLGRRTPWPQWTMKTRPPRLAILLARAFRMGDEGEDRETINALLEHAWRALRTYLTAEQDGWRLDLLDRARLATVDQAWLCPASGQVLDTTLRGHTPYQPWHGGRVDPGTETASRLVMPKPRYLFRRRIDDGSSAPLSEIRAWLEQDETIRALRDVGAWQEVSDRIVESAHYFRVAEHSAQVPPRQLEKYEKAFKAGSINILSCSTTMELGVDIGGLSAVSMNNAPPNPANFLQRVGRAGRRGERAAVSLTVCRNLPHDMAVFRNPLWAFVTPMYVTDVSLDSAPIVQRHVNALCLTHFLLDYEARSKPIHKLHAGWFFESEDGVPSVCDQFREFLAHRAEGDDELVNRIHALLRRSAKEHTRIPRLLEDVAGSLDRPERAYRGVLEGLEEEMTKLDTRARQRSPVARAIERQLKRHRGEYLLGYLATHQFLPGYGFPTNVVPFVTTTAEELRARREKRRDREEGEQDIREDNRALVRGFPTRDLRMALREYAPGAEVVLDGRSYRSAGVTLNWHLPPDPTENEVAETLDLRVLNQCRSCGAFQVSRRLAARCDACGSEEVQAFTYLTPAGFAVDIRSRARPDLGIRPWSPPLVDFISSGDGLFAVLGRPPVVHLRHTDHGELVRLSFGQFGHGYAVCLRCGRAVPETARPGAPESDGLPEPMEDHRRLRGGKNAPGGGKDSSLCEGNGEPFAIKRHLALGTRLITDVLELRFIDPQDGQPLRDRKVATSLAVALRIALAERLGIEEEELGFHVAAREEGGHTWAAVFLYDTADGGAGFCAQAPGLLPELLRLARRRLECPNHCDSACHACLLGHDTQFSRTDLDRHSALRFLSDKFINALKLPDDARCFGEATTLEWQPLLDAMARLSRRYPIERARVVLHGTPEAWDLPSWRGVDFLLRLVQSGVPVELLVHEHALATMDWVTRRQLANLAEFGRLHLLRAEDGAGLAGRQAIVAAFQHPVGWTTYATSDADAACPGPAWLLTRPDTINVHGTTTTSMLPEPLEALAPDDVRVDPPGTVVEVPLPPDAPLYGSARGFGRRFWAYYAERYPRVADCLRRGPATRIVYTDRYLRSPASALGLYLVLRGLKDLEVFGQKTRLEVHTSKVRGEPWARPARIHHDWPDPETQQAVLASLMAWLGHGVTPHLVDHPRELPHARILSIHWASNGRPTRTLELRLDQGIGFFRVAVDTKERSKESGPRFPFHLPPDEQTRRLKGTAWKLVPAGDHPVYSYLLAT